MSKRITGRTFDGIAFIRSETGTEGVGHFTTQRRLPEIISKLAKYEDEEEAKTIGCEYCKNEAALYQSNRFCELYLDKGSPLGNLRVHTKNNCPPYAECSSRGSFRISAFRINYCPNCGRKLVNDE